MRHDLVKDKTCTIPGTKQKGSSEIFPRTDGLGDGTNTDHYLEPDAETNSEQFSSTNAYPAAYDLR